MIRECRSKGDTESRHLLLTFFDLFYNISWVAWKILGGGVQREVGLEGYHGRYYN